MEEYSLTISAYDMNVLDEKFGMGTRVRFPYFRDSYDIGVEFSEDRVSVEYEGLFGTKVVEKTVNRESEMAEIKDWFRALDVKPSRPLTILTP